MDHNKHIKTGNSGGAITQINTHQLEIKSVKHELMLANDRVKSLSKKLSKMLNHSPLEVSDHAVVRYLQRAKGIYIDEVKDEIRTQTLTNYYKRLGDGEYPLDPEGYAKAVVKYGVVITILM